MEPESIDRIFWDAAQIASAEERGDYLDRACGDDVELRRQVDRLLAAKPEAESFLESPAVRLPATVDYCPASDGPGTVIGPYKLLEQIGEGGFGVVFMAEQQQPVRRKVALKVLKPGMDSRQVIARFEAERQALALMDHPHIAKILDAGQTTSGRPYFVMELVKGIPITEYGDQVRLPVRERLELFVVVCRAVQHAHQNAIIHRDIKPSNVLVTLHDGTPVVKVIDFGIAKARGQPLTDKTLFTGFAELIGTPLYMSPEQASLSGLDVDTRSDVYSLGVLLYELLTGTTPFDQERLRTAAYDEIRRIIREEEPARPSAQISTLGQAATVVSANRRSDPKRLSQLFRGELDWVVMKALEKDRNRRYETARDLALDVEHYLHDEPVHACPPSAMYRVRKFARRNKTGLAVAGLVLLAAVAFGGGAVWVMQDRAARLAATEQEVKRALDEATTLQGQAKWPEALEAARQAQAWLAHGGSDELRRRARELGRDLEMVMRLEEIRLPDVIGGMEGHVDYAATDAKIAKAFRDYGIDMESLGPAEAGERIRDRPIRHELAVALDHWVKVRTSVLKGKRGANDPLRKRLLAAARVADPDEWRNQLRSALEQGQMDTLTKLAASGTISDLPPQSLSLLGWALDSVGAWEQAVAVLRPAQQKYPGEFLINFQLARSLEKGGHRFPADQVTDEVIRFYTVARALRPRNVPVHTLLGHSLCRRGRFDEAIAVYRRAVELDPEVVVHRYWLALAQLVEGDRAGYRRTCAAMLDDFGKTDDPDGAYWVAWTAALAEGSVNNLDRPVQMADAALEGDPENGRHASALGAALYRAGRFIEAVQWLDQASAAFQQNGTKTTTYSPAYSWFFLAMAHHRLGHEQQAREWLNKATKRTEQENRNESLRWNRRFTLRLLRNEAEELVLAKKN
jgi:serine/threonine protein kinase/tetratricopeptide (TPR) repeat protein